MARADRRRVQRPKSAARPVRAPERAAKPKRGGGPRQPTLEETLFFTRLRTHAKWVFVFLALAFAGTFVVFGVGSGGSGLGDLLFLNNGGGGSGDTPSLSDARAAVAKNPRSAVAQYELAQAAQQEGDNDTAIAALETYATLRPSDREKLEELASLYLAKGQTHEGEARAASAESQLATASPVFQTNLLAPPKGKEKTPQTVTFATGQTVEQAITSQASAKFNEAYQAMSSAYSKAEATYQKVTAVAPKDPTAQLQLAQVAQQAGDLQTAAKAYAQFLKLAPDDPNASLIREQLKQIRAQLQPAKSASG